jgi:hypothetical protein
MFQFFGVLLMKNYLNYLFDGKSPEILELFNIFLTEFMAACLSANVLSYGQRQCWY